MWPMVIFSFLVMFALIALTISIGLRYQEGQRKKKVTEMLQTGLSDGGRVETKVLLEAEAEDAGLAKLIAGFNFSRGLEKRIEQSGLNWNLNTMLIGMLALTIPGALIGAKFKPLLFDAPSILATALVFATAPYIYMMRARKKRLAAFEEQFPDALDFLGRAMRAGHAFSIALEMLSEESQKPLKQEFRKVFNEHNLGLPIETALGNLCDRMPLLDVKFFVSAVLLQRETGGNLSEILAKLALVIRERFKLKGQVMAASAHGRITGTILTLMPVALMFGLLIVAPGYLQGMAADETGRYMIAGVIIGLILGHLIIRKIVDIKV